MTEVSNSTTKRKRESSRRDYNAPKPPLPAYYRFLQDKRHSFEKKHPNKSYSDYKTEFSAKWSSMTDEQKKPWTDAYDEDHNKWLKKKEKYVKENPNPILYTKEEWKDIVQQKKMEKDPAYAKRVRKTVRNKQLRKQKDPSKPQRLGSSWLLFSQAYREMALKHLTDSGENNSAANVLKYLSKLWHSAPEDVRKTFDDIAEEGKVLFQKQMEEYQSYELIDDIDNNDDDDDDDESDDDDNNDDNDDDDNDDNSNDSDTDDDNSNSNDSEESNDSSQSNSSDSSNSTSASSASSS